MPNPFEYFKKPKDIMEAQSNVNYWWYEKMGGVPVDTVEANWNTYIKEMMREADKELSNFT